MEHLGPQAGQLQHFIEGDLLQLPGPLDVAGVGSVDAVHIGIDLAEICLQGCGQGHGGGVRPSPSQGGDVTILVDPLEAGDNDDGVVPVNFRLDALHVDLLIRALL